MDVPGLLRDGLVDGLIYAPVGIGFALGYRLRGEIDISLDAAVISGGVAFAALLTGGWALPVAMAAGALVGALVAGVCSVVHLWLGVPMLLGGIIVSFIVHSVSTMLVGEGVPLLAWPNRLFVTRPVGLDLVGGIVLGLSAALAARRGGAPGAVTAGVALLTGFSAWYALGVASNTLAVALIFAAAAWAVGSAFERRDVALANRAITSSPTFQLDRSATATRMACVVVAAVLVGVGGTVLAQYKARAAAGGSFDVVVGALCAFLMVDRPIDALRGTLERRIVRNGGGTRATERWLFRALDPSVSTRALLGSLLFAASTQLLIAWADHPESPQLLLGMLLLVVLADWSRVGRWLAAGARGAEARAREGIAIRGVHKSFTRGGGVVPVLVGVDLELRPEERIVHLSGVNASGKSTLFRVLAGFTPADAGVADVAGRSILEQPRHKRGVFLVGQDPFLTVAADLTIAENLRLAARLGGAPVDPVEHLTRLGLDSVLFSGVHGGVETRAGHLSGGQAQCLALAMAVAAQAKLVLADEPTANLDPSNAERVVDLLGIVARSSPLLLISHDARSDRIVDRHVFLRHGRLEAS